MKKIFTLSLLIFTLLFLTSCKEETNEHEPNNPPHNSGDKVQLLTDRHFKSGFSLLGISPVEDGRDIKKHLDYDGKATEQSKTSPWIMAQWWTPYNVVDAIYTEKNNTYSYQTPSRTININPSDNGYLNFDLKASKEYENPRKEGEPWTHLLIEQDFSTKVKMNEMKSLVMSMEVKIDKVENLTGPDYNPGRHAAQLLWYVTMKNVLPSNDIEDSGQNGDFLWFGIPIFDNRVDFIPQSAHIDQGGPGTTNKLIYSISSRNYFSEPIVMGKEYKIEIDIFPYLQDAFISAVTQGLLKDVKFENMEIGYMNFGWECPGSFDVNSTIKNISIEAEIK